MSAHIQQASMLSGRSMTMLAVFGLHALVIAALMAIRVIPELIDRVPPPIEWVPLEKQPVPLPPEPEAQHEKFTGIARIPLPEIPEGAAQWEPVPEMRPQGPLQNIAEESGAAGKGSVLPAGPTSQLQYRAMRPTDDYYPSSALLREQQGAAIVQVCVDAGGQLQGAPAIQASSGHRQLDVAAIRWVRESLRFTPAMKDGVAVASCKGFRVNFTLH